MEEKHKKELIMLYKSTLQQLYLQNKEFDKMEKMAEQCNG